MEDLETSARLEFHGVAYEVTLQVASERLHLQVESDGRVWTGSFPAEDVEQLTRHTGNVKRFRVFVQMLLTALNRQSDAVFVDLLTAADLELYRQRKLPGLVQTEGANSGKRYLILTYAVEFDRVHYPLPLNAVLTPSPEVLQRTIRRLRQQLAQKEMNGEGPGNTQLLQEIAALREENRCLKNTLAQYCDEGGGGINSTVDLQRELQASIEENKELIAIYQQFREDSAAETARLRAEIKQLRIESQQSGRSELAKQEQERLETRRKIKDSNAAVQESLTQMLQMKAQLEESQLKNRELLRQLAIRSVTPSSHDGYAKCTPLNPETLDGASLKVNYESHCPINHELASTTESGDFQYLIIWHQMDDNARRALNFGELGLCEHTHEGLELLEEARESVLLCITR